MKKQERMIKMAYIAGALDGDGSFSLFKKHEIQSRSPLYFPAIQLSNLSKNLIDFLRNQIGGTIFRRKPYIAKDGANRRECWQWRLEKAPKCLPFLEEIVPYLQVKKERAEFLMDYIKNNPFKRGSNKLSFNVLQKREDYYLKMRRFNEKPFQGKIFSKKRKNNDSELFWSYLAGLLDTDGSFSVGRHHHKSRLNPSYSPYISLSMIDTRGLNHILENCIYGFVKLYKASSTINGFCYRWALHAKDEVIFVLEKIIPFLIIKKRNAEILLDFCKNKVRTNKCRKGTSQEELDFRECCYQALKKFNYGIYKSSLMDSKPLPDNAEGNEAEGKCHRERSKREDTRSGDAVL